MFINCTRTYPLCKLGPQRLAHFQGSRIKRTDLPNIAKRPSICFMFHVFSPDLFLVFDTVPTTLAFVLSLSSSISSVFFFVWQKHMHISLLLLWSYNVKLTGRFIDFFHFTIFDKHLNVSLWIRYGLNDYKTFMISRLS